MISRVKWWAAQDLNSWRHRPRLASRVVRHESATLNGKHGSGYLNTAPYPFNLGSEPFYLLPGALPGQFKIIPITIRKMEGL